MVSASILPPGSYLKFLPWLSSVMGCKLQDEINPFFSQVVFGLKFITAIENELRQEVRCEVLVNFTSLSMPGFSCLSITIGTIMYKTVVRIK